MTIETCAPTAAICGMIVARSGMAGAIFDATAEGKFSSLPWGRAARTAAGRVPAPYFRGR